MDIRNHPEFDKTVSFLEDDRKLPRGTLKALVGVESGGNPNARSPVGAQGLTQFMPATAKEYNVDVTNPWDSLRGTADYLYDLNQKYNGNFKAALAHYNGGAYNAQYQVDGTVPDASKVSAKNHDVNKKYVNDIHSKIEGNASDPQAQAAKIEAQVADAINRGDTPTSILRMLKDAGLSETIELGRNKGYSPQEIIKRIGGEPAAKVLAAQSKVDGQGFFTNAAQGAGIAVTDVVEGAKQVGARLTGNDARLAQLQQEQAARERSPERQALERTAGGTVGNAVTKAAPYVAAGLAAPAGVIPALVVNGGLGALDGALTPTTGEGQFGSNIALGAGVGAVGAGVGELIGRGVAKTASKALAPDAEAAARLAAAQEYGLPVNTAAVGGQNSFYRNLINNLPENGTVRGFQNEADQAIARQVAKGVGIEDWQGGITHELLNAARPGIQEAFNVTANKQIPFSLELRNLIKQAKEEGGDSLGNILNRSVIGKWKISDPIEGKHFQDLNASLRDFTKHHLTLSDDRSLAKQIVEQMNKDVYGSLNDVQKTAFDEAKKKYAHLKAVEKMVSLNNDFGTVTPRQMMQAIKTGDFKGRYLQGNAPYQELAAVAEDLYGKGKGAGFGASLGSALGKLASNSNAALIFTAGSDPITALKLAATKKLAELALSKAATSQSPRLINALTNANNKGISPEMQKYIANALKTTSTSGSSSTNK